MQNCQWITHIHFFTVNTIDFSLSATSIRISTTTSNDILVTLLVDNVALEDVETFKLKLVLSRGSLPRNAIFLDEMTVSIMDRDGMTIKVILYNIVPTNRWWLWFPWTFLLMMSRNSVVWYLVQCHVVHSLIISWPGRNFFGASMSEPHIDELNR